MIKRRTTTLLLTLLTATSLSANSAFALPVAGSLILNEVDTQLSIQARILAFLQMPPEPDELLWQVGHGASLTQAMLTRADHLLAQHNGFPQPVYQLFQQEQITPGWVSLILDGIQSGTYTVSPRLFSALVEFSRSQPRTGL